MEFNNSGIAGIEVCLPPFCTSSALSTSKVVTGLQLKVAIRHQCLSTQDNF